MGRKFSYCTSFMCLTISNALCSFDHPGPWQYHEDHYITTLRYYLTENLICSRFILISILYHRDIENTQRRIEVNSRLTTHASQFPENELRPTIDSAFRYRGDGSLLDLFYSLARSSLPHPLICSIIELPRPSPCGEGTQSLQIYLML